MTYKELLQKIADKSVENYKVYLQSKIDALIHEDESLADKTQQHKDAAEYFEKKLNAVLATAKNGDGPDQLVPEDKIDDFLK